MLHRLLIKNLVLVTNCDIELQPGFNVITGETGAGKSVFLTALSLLMGERADSETVRHGEEMAIIEATFATSIDLLSLAQTLGVDLSDESYIIIRREVSRNGKSRSLINGQVVANSVLKQITPSLVEECGQHAHLKLKTATSARDFLDNFAELAPLLEKFQESLQEEQGLSNKALELQKQLEKRDARLKTLKETISEIEQAKLKEGEDEELFARYSKLEHSHELREQFQAIQGLLENDRGGILTLVKRLKPLLEKAQTLSDDVAESTTHLNSALAELQELSYLIQKEHSRVDVNPQVLDKMKERLSLYDKLKRRYGPSLVDIQRALTQMHLEKETFQQLDQQLLETQEALIKVQANTNAFALKIHTSREKSARLLSKAIQAEIRELNMPHAEFLVELAPALRTSFGDDKVTFMLKPNPGEKQVAVHESASGGELARLFLALQLALFQKAPKRSLLFDEIDANIGGETATVVGKKLKNLGTSTQILCITHFPQVASFADAHFRIEKEVIEGRTISQINRLVRPNDIEFELKRMMGNIHQGTKSP